MKAKRSEHLCVNPGIFVILMLLIIISQKAGAGVVKRTSIFSDPATVVKLDTGGTCVHEVSGNH